MCVWEGSAPEGGRGVINTKCITPTVPHKVRGFWAAGWNSCPARKDVGAVSRTASYWPEGTVSGTHGAEPGAGMPCSHSPQRPSARSARARVLAAPSSPFPTPTPRWSPQFFSQSLLPPTLLSLYGGSGHLLPTALQSRDPPRISSLCFPRGNSNFHEREDRTTGSAKASARMSNRSRFAHRAQQWWQLSRVQPGLCSRHPALRTSVPEHGDIRGRAGTEAVRRTQ